MTRSFAEQALHYFRREHDGVAREPIGGAAAWRGSELAQRDDWIVRLGAAQISELEAAASRVRARGRDIGSLTRDDFALPSLAAAFDAWRGELDGDRGFLVVRGLPVERWDEATAGLAFWGIGLHLGEPGAQNPDGDLLGHVFDTGEESENPNVRRYRTAGDIRFHCDLADVVGLLCLETPRSGGASRLVSSVSVYNALLAEHPELVERLYESFALDLRDEGRGAGPGHISVPPCRYHAGRLRTFFHSDYFHSAPRHADVPPFTPAETLLLERYEALANSAELRLDMQFEPGDMQFVSNHSVLHARTAYEDGERRRHLLRLWLSL